MTFSFDDRIKMPEDVLISGLQAESVLLNLNSERYYGLNDVGTRMLTLLTVSAGSDLNDSGTLKKRTG